MKQSDIFTIIIIASIGMVGAFFASNALLGDPNELMLKHKTISQITPDLVAPDPETFNQDAINPTVEVYVDRAELVACGKATPEQAAEEEKAAEEKKKAEEQKKEEEQSVEDAKNKSDTQPVEQNGTDSQPSANTQSESGSTNTNN